MAFAIVFTERADGHLAGLRAYEQARVVDEIEEQLAHEPLTRTSRKKELKGVSPSFEHVPPVWQLRIDAYRVIYDVDIRTRAVVIRAILYKGNKMTKEIL
jgi:mRNA-degrading endonuclease RelE of RelBE toxin-antitoxin system